MEFPKVPNEHKEHSAVTFAAARLVMQRLVEQHQATQANDPNNPHETNGFGD